MGMRSIFTIIGPIMVGPSSSHTAGAVNIGLSAREYVEGKIEDIEITLYGSFAGGYKGHKTDVALIGGCLGFDTGDIRVRDSFKYAKDECINVSLRIDKNDDFHTNTAVLKITDTNGRIVSVRGKSIGGGAHKIDIALEIDAKGDIIENLYTASGDDDSSDILVKGLETCDELIKEAELSNLLISDIVVEQEAAALGISKKEVRREVAKILKVMKKAVEDGIKGDIKSIGGLTGNDAYKLNQAIKNKETKFDDTYLKAAAWSMAVNEINTEMGIVSACPTGGACGLVAGTVLAAADSLGSSDDEIIDALITAGGIGQRYTKVYSLSASVGGCQVEVGVAAGLAAASTAQLMGGSPSQIGEATAICLKSIIGLTCGALGGLCESPCIKRNGTGSSLAITSANMGLAGINSQIPLDEVIWAIKNTGEHLPEKLLGTKPTGLAATPTGIKKYEEVYGKEKAEQFIEEFKQYEMNKAEQRRM